MSASDPVEEFLAGIERADLPRGIFCEDVVLDATVPNWRFRVKGADAVVGELAKWYADVGHFEELKRSAIGGGELVEFTLRWEEDGSPHACHQAHVIQLRDGGIMTDTVFCGGRWAAPLLAEMEAARRSV